MVDSHNPINRVSDFRTWFIVQHWMGKNQDVEGKQGIFVESQIYYN